MKTGFKMKKIISFFAVALIITACGSINQNTLTQVSTIDALLAGYYDGVMPLNKLTDYGNFGIGTFNKLDGEMIVLDGKIYQFKADGKIHNADLNNTTPFASVVDFKSNLNLPDLSPINYSSFQSKLDSVLENKNLFYAIKVSGKFSYIKTRTVPSQEKPYKPLNEVTKTQPIFEKNEIEGTLIGFRLPPYITGINVPGYHLHFLSSDFSFGGHILDFTIETANVQIQVIKNFYMMLPGENSDFGKIDLSKDRSKELHEVEK